MQVFLIEDNPADADLTREILSSGSVPLDLTVAASGTEALDYIHKRGRFACARTPDLILLDLNLPGVDGKGVLANLKQDPEFKHVPVSVLTSSTSEKDIAESYELGANCYLVKPLDFRRFQATIRALEDFWFVVARLPHQ